MSRPDLLATIESVVKGSCVCLLFDTYLLKDRWRVFLRGRYPNGLYEYANIVVFFVLFVD